MEYVEALSSLLEGVLAPTSYCIEDMLDHGMNDWHALVLLDDAEHFSLLALETLNDRNFAGDTALDIAYRLNRVSLIGKLEAAGALGDTKNLEEKGVGRFIENDKYVHLPGKQGKLKTLEKRYMEGGCLNSRDRQGNTPIHLVAENGHFKAAKYFSEKHFMFNVDLDAKNDAGMTPRNLALLAGHQDIADQLLIWEIESWITSTRLRYQLKAGLKEMLPKRKTLKRSCRE